MMSDLEDLYQEVIVDHSRRPRNFKKLENANRHAEGYNPLCGDKVSIYLKLENDAVTDISFQGSGCAISTASASLLTEALKGRTRAEAEALFEGFHDLVTDGQRAALPAPSSASPSRASALASPTPPLGKLAVFSGVSKYPVRVKCAILAWHTFRAALAGNEEVVSTERPDEV